MHFSQAPVTEKAEKMHCWHLCVTVLNKPEKGKKTRNRNGNLHIVTLHMNAGQVSNFHDQTQRSPAPTEDERNK